MDCKEVCDENAFCYKVKSYQAESGHDILLQDLDNEYAVTVKTEKGKEFVEKYMATQAVDHAALEDFKLSKMKTFSKYTLFKEFEKLPEVFEASKDHSIWKEEGDRCLSCGTCRDCHLCETICPTHAISRRELKEVDDFEYVSDHNKCIACGFCADTCPCGIWQIRPY